MTGADTATPADMALSIRRRLAPLGEEAAMADLAFVAYLIEKTISELDDVIAAAAQRH
jgi:predicted DNA-binding protein